MPHIGRRLLTGLLLLLGATQASAQWHIGIEGGYTNNRLARFRTFDYTRQYTARGGFTVALPVRYAFNDWFALQAEVTFLQKNYGLRRIGPRAQEYTDYTNSFLEVPLLARFAFGGERLRGFLHAGGYVGWWASSHNRGQRLLDIPEGVLMPFDQPVAFDARRDNRFEAGLLAGVGIAYRLSPASNSRPRCAASTASPTCKNPTCSNRYPATTTPGSVGWASFSRSPAATNLLTAPP